MCIYTGLFSEIFCPNLKRPKAFSHTKGVLVTRQLGVWGGAVSSPVGPEQSPENFKNLALKFPQKQQSYHTPKAFTKPIFDTQFFPFLLSFFISGLIHKWIEKKKKKHVKFFYRNKIHLK